MAIIAVAQWRTNPEAVIKALTEEFERAVGDTYTGCVQVVMRDPLAIPDPERLRAKETIKHAIEYLVINGNARHALIDDINESIALAWATNILGSCQELIA